MGRVAVLSIGSHLDCLVSLLANGLLLSSLHGISLPALLPCIDPVSRQSGGIQSSLMGLQLRRLRVTIETRSSLPSKKPTGSSLNSWRIDSSKKSSSGNVLKNTGE